MFQWPKYTGSSVKKFYSIATFKKIFMKTVSSLSLIIVIFCSSTISNAQFLNKLIKSVEDKVENTVINKTSDKAADKASSGLDKLFDPQFGSKKAGKKVDPTNLPNSFEFDYQYRMTMTTKQGAIDMDYFLKPGAPYLGIKMNMGTEMFMVMDGEENINYMFMDMGQNKFGTATSINSADMLDDEDAINDYTFSDLPNRTFLGFDCKGKRMEDKDNVIIMYYTNEAEISFNDVFKSDSERFPEAIRNQFKDAEGALMMYLEMEDKVNKGKKNTSATMECTILQPSSFTFKTAGYTFM
jgi:hypothetical protein